MTECESLIKEGKLSEEFLKEETRNDYNIPHEMKKVWAIEFDLLKTFVSVCKKHNLTYWAGFGTLLGAVRHKGMIPWDDDLDVWMPRADYDKLLKLNQEEFCYPYYLQTTENDIDYYCPFARLRNSNTCGLLVSKKNKCNNGIYIDIYPIDYLSQNGMVQSLRSRTAHLLNVISNAYLYNVNPSKITRFIHNVLNLPFIKFDYKKVYRFVNSISSKNEYDNSTEMGITVFKAYKYNKLKYNKNDFEETIELDFEGFKIAAPKGYHNILSVLYGDYMEFPPVEKRGAWHSFMFEPDIPYKEYCSKEYGTKYE